MRLCASESFKSEIATPKTAVGRLCVEQLTGVHEAAFTSLDLAAGGSVAGGVLHPQG